MNLDFNCPHCNRLLSIDEKWRSTQVECPDCKRVIVPEKVIAEAKREEERAKKKEEHRLQKLKREETTQARQKQKEEARSKKQREKIKKELAAGKVSPKERGLLVMRIRESMRIFESKVLFQFTRLMALGMIGLLLISLVLNILSLPFMGISKRLKTRVTFKEVAERLEPKKPPVAGKEVSTIEGFKLPKNVDKFFGDSRSRGVLREWLLSIEASDRKDFLKNLSVIIKGAERNEKIDVRDAVNKYANIKLEKLRSDPFSKYDRQIKLFSILLMVGMVALFSLVLVLLAIERNTRDGIERKEKAKLPDL